MVLRELYPSKEALDAAGTGAADAMVETFDQLDELLVTLGESSEGNEQTSVGSWGRRRRGQCLVDRRRRRPVRCWIWM